MGSEFQLGTLNLDPISPGLDRLNTLGDVNIYKFHTDRTENFHMLVSNISQGDRLQVELFKDIDHDGAITSKDTRIGSKVVCGAVSGGGSNDGTIDRRDLEGGDYLVKVSSILQSGDATYNFAVQGTLNSVAPRLLERIELGTLSSDKNLATVLDDQHTNKGYHFTVPTGKTVKVNMTMTGGDADMRAFQDINNNQIVDLNPKELNPPVFGFPNHGTTPESLTFSAPGEYYLQLNQFSAGTNITANLNFDVI